MDKKKQKRIVKIALLAAVLGWIGLSIGSTVTTLTGAAHLTKEGTLKFNFFDKNDICADDESTTATIRFEHISSIKKGKVVNRQITVKPLLGDCTKPITANLPDGWVQNASLNGGINDDYARYPSKTVENSIYFMQFVNGETTYRKHLCGTSWLSTFCYTSTDFSTEGFLNPTDKSSSNHQSYKNTTLKRVTTAKGREIYLVKSVNDNTGKGVLLLSASNPDPANNYIKYEGQNIGVGIRAIGADCSSNSSAYPCSYYEDDIDFSNPGTTTIIDDFEKIAASLNL